MATLVTATLPPSSANPPSLDATTNQTDNANNADSDNAEANTAPDKVKADVFAEMREELAERKRWGLLKAERLKNKAAKLVAELVVKYKADTQQNAE